MAFVTLAGPAVSMLFAILFLPFALIGGVAGQIAVAGFIMNLMTAVYNLMPFSPMDGKVIYELEPALLDADLRAAGAVLHPHDTVLLVTS